MKCVLVLSLVLVCSGCAYEWPDESSAGYICDTGDDCASGFICDSNSSECVPEEAGDTSDGSDTPDPGNCLVGQHEVDGRCYEHNDVEHCFNGSSSVDCTELDVPANSSANCMGVGDELFPAFECGFECIEGYEEEAGECVAK
ncbi:MAG: hypothetical protein HOI23_10500 [Deltaproteobacteria bacterium]|jgi:hypothetical protein|nr:hypothetical protein [Deltaproteobacteria bacterium]MBT6433330.1 hypothetical protein [Deltaproteobacteria bacterium]MBT6490039.1 hypothetical protein [Deltaproteobacteria bacterium]